MAEEEKEHPATAKQRQRFAERGEMPQVKDLTQAAMLAGGGLLILVCAEDWASRVTGLLRNVLGSIARPSPQLWLRTTDTFWQILRPLFVVSLTIAVGMGIVRQRGAVGFRLPKVDFGRVDPLRRLSSMLSGGQGFAGLLRAAVKLVMVATVAGSLLVERVPAVLQQVPVSLAAARLIAARLVGDLFLRGSIALLILGAWEFWRSWRGLERRMSMSPQEVRDEVREQVGDPAVRGRIKSKARELLKKRMLLRVPRADVVVVNPTHLAVALAYDETRMRAPEVLAKGAGDWAARIRAIARRSGVPVVQDPPLARLLYERVDVAESVPEELYQATAVVIAHVFRLRRRMV